MGLPEVLINISHATIITMDSTEKHLLFKAIVTRNST